MMMNMMIKALSDVVEDHQTSLVLFSDDWNQAEIAADVRFLTQTARLQSSFENNLLASEVQQMGQKRTHYRNHCS
jgi:hypothetical protein